MTPESAGATPYGQRRIFPVAGGRFEGARVRGTVLPETSGDWLLMRSDAAFQQDVRLLLRTHDEALIDRLLGFAEREGIPRERFELQMLYGVRSGLQLDYLGRGYKVLVATPYGPEWYPYLMRRLAERPANLGFLVRNLVRR